MTNAVLLLCIHLKTTAIRKEEQCILVTLFWSFARSWGFLACCAIIIKKNAMHVWWQGVLWLFMFFSFLWQYSGEVLMKCLAFYEKSILLDLLWSMFCFLFFFLQEISNWKRENKRTKYDFFHKSCMLKSSLLLPSTQQLIHFYLLFTLRNCWCLFLNVGSSVEISHTK